MSSIETAIQEHGGCSAAGMDSAGRINNTEHSGEKLGYSAYGCHSEIFGYTCKNSFVRWTEVVNYFTEN